MKSNKTRISGHRNYKKEPDHKIRIYVLLVLKHYVWNDDCALVSNEEWRTPSRNKTIGTAVVELLDERIIYRSFYVPLPKRMNLQVNLYHSYAW